jgi:hypothetical protein
VNAAYSHLEVILYHMNHGDPVSQNSVCKAEALVGAALSSQLTAPRSRFTGSSALAVKITHSSGDTATFSSDDDVGVDGNGIHPRAFSRTPAGK